MKIYKFGGSSVKNSKRVKKLYNLLKEVGHKKTLIVISAIGNTTNKLEKVVNKYFLKQNTEIQISEIEGNHLKMINDLFPYNHKINIYIKNIFNGIKYFLKKKKYRKYNFLYDQVVGSGELISTKLISEYLNFIGMKNIWLDCRNYIKTDNSYCEAHVNWTKTNKKIKQLKKNYLYITQGFIGADYNYFTTTLGREGSDYTASIFSYCLKAESQTTWKDVSGILNADPRFFLKNNLLNSLSYDEALELSYYGASVIHTKTLHPLKKKQIPLYVRSFIYPKKKGTLVSKKRNKEIIKPCFIVKKNHKLISFYMKNFSFFLETNIRDIFTIISKYKIKVFLIQSSSISLSICVEDQFHNLNILINNLKSDFIIKLLNNVYLYTILHYNNYYFNFFFQKIKIILRQINSDTAQWIIK
ncbi:aspartate kinase [Candidatus Karelsulcia muelleri]|uniref:aspartate kinase n=1 Tax=Candidatus Karelsulcia muelleri TaxID=336810 RepID=UPI00216B4A83|nr:aspartate kinase [Candidatus Karelsulcia muelleri]